MNVDTSNIDPGRAGEPSRASIRSPLDHRMYPHLLSLVVDLAPLDALLALRACSRALRDNVDQRLFEHVVLVTVAPRNDGKAGVGFTSPDSPDRLLPCISSVRQLPRPSGGGDERNPRTQSAEHLASNRRMMGYIRILDSSTEKLYDMPTLPPLPLVRRCNPQAAGIPAHTLVQRLSLASSSDGVGDGIVNAWDRFRYLAVTPTGTTPTGSATGAQGRAPRDARASLVVHVEYDASAPPRRGIVLDVRRRDAVRHLTLVLPPADTTWSMGEVVEGLRVTLMMALPSTGGGTRITLVGVERFGARHFGVDGAEGQLEATRSALLADCHLDADDPRLRCLSFEAWAAEVGSEISAPPPDTPCIVLGPA